MCFICEGDTGDAPQAKRTALILAIREKFMDCVSLEPNDFGRAGTVSLADHGLQPYEQDGNTLGWNTVNHTQSLGVHIPPTFYSQEEAVEIKRVLDTITELQERHEVEPPEPSLRSVALDALLDFAVHKRLAPSFQCDSGCVSESPTEA